MSLTTAERTAKHRAKRLAEGWVILHCTIPPEAAQALAEATKDGKTKAEAVSEALLRGHHE